MEAPVSDLGPEARAILEDGRAGDDPSPADRARVKRALMRSIAAGGVLSAASAKPAAAKGAAVNAAGKTISLGLSGKLIGAAVLVGALGAGIAVARSRGESPAAPLPAPAAAEPLVESAAPIEAPPSGPLASASDAPAPPTSAMPRDDVSNPAPKGLPRAPARSLPAPAASVAGEDPLVIATRRMREVNGALQAGNPEKAIALLDEPSDSGELREERAAARVLALCKLGKHEEASAAAAAFLRDSPRSPLADRVRAGCPAVPAR